MGAFSFCLVIWTWFFCLYIFKNIFWCWWLIVIRVFRQVFKSVFEWSICRNYFLFCFVHGGKMWSQSPEWIWVRAGKKDTGRYRKSWFVLYRCSVIPAWERMLIRKASRTCPLRRRRRHYSTWRASVEGPSWPDSSSWSHPFGFHNDFCFVFLGWQ